MSSDENTQSELFQPAALITESLVSIMKDLSVVELINLSRKDDNYKDLITNRVMTKKLLNLSELNQASKNDVLQTFGKSMRKFTIDEINLNDFLDTVMKYCSPDTLVTVELKLTEPVTVDLDKIDRSMPFFTNLNKMKLQVLECDTKHCFEGFLRRLFEAANNLQSLELHRVNLSGVWFKRKETKSLRSFRLIQPYFLSSATLTRFISSLPNLETFMYKGDQDITFIGNTLATYCAKLKSFVDIHTPVPNNHRRADSHRYTFLSSFSQLNYITLTSCTFCGSDLFYLLVQLSSKNIEKLRIFVDLEDAIAYSGQDCEDIMRSSFAEFRSLRELEVCVQNSTDEADLQCDFIIHMAKQLKNLDTFSLKSGKLANANKINELLPKINKLSISEALFKHVPVEMRKIVLTLRTIQQQMGPDDERKLLKLVVNMQQWKELQVYKDANNLVEAILDPALKPFNYERREFLLI